MGYLGLGNNHISDVSPLTALTALEVLELRDNPLDAAAVDVHIPAIEANRTEVHYGHGHGHGHTHGGSEGGAEHSHAADYIQHGRQHFAVGDYAGGGC